MRDLGLEASTGSSFFIRSSPGPYCRMHHRVKAAIMAKRIPHPVCDVDSDVFWSEWRGPLLVG